MLLQKMRRRGEPVQKEHRLAGAAGARRIVVQPVRPKIEKFSTHPGNSPRGHGRYKPDQKWNRLWRFSTKWV